MDKQLTKDGVTVTVGSPGQVAALISEGWQVVNKTAVAITYDATDAAIQLANEHGLDLDSVIGTGKNGRITLNDVRAIIS